MTLRAGRRLRGDVAIDIGGVEVVHGRRFDLSKGKVRSKILDRVRSDDFDGSLSPPPCVTSLGHVTLAEQARQPCGLRSANWLRGFPRLQGRKHRQVRDAMGFIDFVFKVAGTLSQDGGYILLGIPRVWAGGMREIQALSGGGQT